VQEIMEKVWRGILGYDPAWRFSTWVYAIARNACCDRARRRLVRPESLPLQEHGGRSATPGPEEELVRGETERLVDRFFASSDAATWQIAFLRFHERLGYREISSVMGVPVGTAKFRIHAIRVKLKAAMEGDDADCRPLRAQAL
jgi:RNA polymerase sigma-70 factor (ECF subfamily)